MVYNSDTYKTMEAAKEAALKTGIHNTVRVVYQFNDSGLYGFFHHPENRYLFSFKPRNSKIVSVHDGEWVDSAPRPSDDIRAAGGSDLLGAILDDLLLSNEPVPTEQTPAPPKGG